MTRRPRWHAIVSPLTDLLLPRSCAGCAVSLRGQRAIVGWCEHCEQSLVNPKQRCLSCALASSASYCPACLRSPPPFERTIALADYAPPLDRLVLALKYAPDPSLAKPLGALLAVRLWQSMPALTTQTAGAPEESAVLTAIPADEDRLARRGFNQALALARVIAAMSGLPLAPRLLRRARSARAQTRLDPQARRDNARGAFLAHPRAAGRSVLVVDDVMTTGATLEAAARALLQAGASRVIALVVARTPQSDVQRRTRSP